MVARWTHTLWALLLALLVSDTGSWAASNEQVPPRPAELDSVFRSAMAHYEASQYVEAEKELQPLVARLPKNFEVNELLGMVYAAQGQDEKANPFLETAVRLKPDDPVARTNLAVSLVRLGKNSLAESEFKKAVDLEPGSYDANHNLGEFYARAGRLSAAIPYLARAQTLAFSHDNGYDLALAYLETGNLGGARDQIQALLKKQDTGELHNLLGEVEEKAGNYLTAASEYERAAHLEPSEKNIFDWGSEMLLHQTMEPAIAVFKSGIRRYPSSGRLHIGLGIALYAHNEYDQATQAFAHAADLVPTDPRPYLFLGKTYSISTAQADGVIARLRRFYQLNPKDAQASYYYALALWKAQRGQERSASLGEIESLLKNAVRLDAGFFDAHLQLGVLYADQHKFVDAIREYQQAIKLQPDSADAHYRLGQTLVRTGERSQAQQEFQVYDRLHKQEVAAAEKQRSEIKQFVVSMKENTQTSN